MYSSLKHSAHFRYNRPTWVISCLIQLPQVLLINRRVSQLISAASGVIHGSFLGLLLFLVHINDAMILIIYGSSLLFSCAIKIVRTLKSTIVTPLKIYIQLASGVLNGPCNFWVKNLMPLTDLMSILDPSLPTAEQSLLDLWYGTPAYPVVPPSTSLSALFFKRQKL